MLSPKTSRFQLSNRVIQTERDSELLLRGHGLENTLLLGMHAGSAIHWRQMLGSGPLSGVNSMEHRGDGWGLPELCLFSELRQSPWQETR